MPSYEIRIAVRDAESDRDQEAATIPFDSYLEARVWFGKLLDWLKDTHRLKVERSVTTRATR